MMNYKSITGTLFNKQTGTRINLGELQNITINAIPQMPQTVTMTPEQVIQEMERRKRAAREAALRAIEEKAERDKRLLHETLSEDAIFSITYVPYVIAEVAWDYADTILDLAVIMRLSETKKLCRAIKETRKDYDRDRYKIINNKWRESETENMIMFQETLSDFFNTVYKTYREKLMQKYSDLEENSLMLIASVYVCRTVLKGLHRYTDAQEKIVSAILGYEIASLFPKQLTTLNKLVIEFAGDSPIDEDEDGVQTRFAEELAEYINDTEINDENKSTPITNNKKQKMTMEQLSKLAAEINAEIAVLQTNLEANVNKNIKAAGVRARKSTLKLEKLFKEYRKNSVQ